MKSILQSCRGCMIEISSKAHANRRLSEKFTYCTNIECSKEDGLPITFCKVCDDTIELCYQFIQEARRVDDVMRQFISTISGDDEIGDVKIEPKFCSPIKVEDDEVKDEYDTLLEIKVDEELDAKEINVNEGQNIEQNVNEELDIEETVNEELDIKDNEQEYLEDFSLDDVDINSSEDDDVSEYLSRKKSKNVETKPITDYERNVKKILAKSKTRRRKSSDRFPIQCEYCNKPFNTRNWYEKHLKSVHADNTDSKFVCKICSRGFSRSDNLKQHMVVHSDERPFACHMCPKQFKIRKLLNQHIRAHREPHKHRCNICNATFQLRSVFNTHMKIHLAKNSNLCHLCGAGFTMTGNLRQHMRTHTGEKPFACAHCSFTCSLSSSMRRHERIHTGVKPHTCQHCDKSFTDINGLKRHVRTHTGELPYQCHLCSRAFIDSSKRKRHILSQHQVAGNAAPANVAAHRDKQPQ